MRVLVALAIAGCFPDAQIERQASYPTLEPEVARARPIDPYPEVPRPQPADADQEPVPGFHGVVAGDPNGDVGDFIASDRELDDPSAVVAMSVRVAGWSPHLHLPSGPSQRVTAVGDVQHLAIRTGPGAVVTGRERKEASHPTARIDAADPAIRRIARAATSGARTDRQRTAALVAWVHANISYVHADEHVASVVLARGSGDCSEMSLLFVALARAAGVPAREVAGLAGTHFHDRPGFGFHAWAEVALEGHWVAVDPTWNEPVADASHIALVEGDLEAFAPRIDELRVAVDRIDHGSRVTTAADVRQLAHELPGFMRLRH